MTEHDDQQFTSKLSETRTAAIVVFVCLAGAAAVTINAILDLSIDQVGIALTGVVAVFLTQSKHESRRKFACIFGTIGQPFWIYAALSARQWGVLFVSGLYTIAWLRGVNLHWLQPWIAKRRS